MTNYVKCKKCGSCINVNTDNCLIWCSCGSVGVDGNEYYTRILGEQKDWEIHEEGIENTNFDDRAARIR